MNWQERIILLLLASINFTHILDFMVVMPLGNKLMPFFQINPQQFSVIVASYSISAFVSGLIAMFFVDRFDRKKVLLFGYIGFIIGTFCCGIAPSHYLLLASRIIAGLFGGLIGSQVLSIVADSFAYEKRAQAMGYLFTAFSIASVIGVPLSLTLANEFSWHAPFFFIAGLGVLIILAVIFYMEPMTKHIHEVHQDSATILSILFKNKTNLLAFSLSALLMLGHFVIIPFLNPFMEFNVGFNELQRNLVYMVGGIATLISAPIAGKLADKYGKHKMFTLFAWLSLIPIIAITHLTPLKYYFVLTITGIWFILASSRNIPAQAIISNVVAPANRGSFMSFNSCIQQAFIGLASLIAGFVVESGPHKQILHYPFLGYFSIVVLLICVYLAWLINKPATKENI